MMYSGGGEGVIGIRISLKNSKMEIRRKGKDCAAKQGLIAKLLSF